MIGIAAVSGWPVTFGTAEWSVPVDTGRVSFHEPNQ